MDFYATIRPWYDQIFPFVPAQRDFVLSFGACPGFSVVDVGCGTGSLIVSLAKVFRTTVGMDPGETMLEAARQKATVEPVGTWLIQSGMLNLTNEFPQKSVDRLICFGNTLPHLSNMDEVREMLRQSHQVLKPGGLILLQIINFQRIFRKQLPGLPTLENDQIRFVRNYRYEGPDPEFIRFHTLLTLKETGETIENDIPLLVISEDQLLTALADTGFHNLQTFGSFTREPFSVESQPLIVVGESTR
ncbi:MAG: methyltransferase domain-containing protein [Bacteroidales bacterium]